MTATLDPIEESALIMLRAFLRGLEEGRFVVTKFAAADNPKELGMSIELGQREPPETEAPTPSPSSPAARTSCSACDSSNVGVGDTEGFCNDCGHTWPKS